MQPDTDESRLRGEQAHLLAFVRQRLVKDGQSGVEVGTALFEEGWINSINILDLIGYVEHRLGRRLDDGELVMSNFKSVQAIVEAFFYD